MGTTEVNSPPSVDCAEALDGKLINIDATVEVRIVANEELRVMIEAGWREDLKEFNVLTSVDVDVLAVDSTLEEVGGRRGLEFDVEVG